MAIRTQDRTAISPTTVGCESPWFHVNLMNDHQKSSPTFKIASNSRYVASDRLFLQSFFLLCFLTFFCKNALNAKCTKQCDCISHQRCKTFEKCNKHPNSQFSGTTKCRLLCKHSVTRQFRRTHFFETLQKWMSAVLSQFRRAQFCTFFKLNM